MILRSHSIGRWLVLVALLGALWPTHAATLLKYNFETSNPWTSMAGYFTAAGGTVSATPSYTNAGTIDTTGTNTASSGLLLTVNSSAAVGNWSAGLDSGVLTLLTSNTRTNSFLTLSFSLSASSAYPIRVKIESYDGASLRTGGLKGIIYPAAADFYQRYAIDLDQMTADGAGTFNPTDPKVRIYFELDSTVNNTGWPTNAAHTLKIDNVNYSTPKYYVSPTGNNTADGLTEATALATIQKAADKLGDTTTDNIVAIMSGADYLGTNVNSQTVLFSKAGTPDAWIVFKNYPGHVPVVRTAGWHAFKFTNNKDGGIDHAASYVEVRGLTVRGLSYVDTNGDRQIDAAYQSYVGLNQGPGNGSGITVDGRPNTDLRPHHFRFADNTVEFMPGAGINILDTDRVAVENNLVRSNCWWMIYAGSGINFYEILNIETGSNYRMLIRDNIAYGNETMVPWFASIGQFSDGEGIILDTYNLTYTGKTLIANNLVFNNGGGGIHVLQASFVDVVHNTAYLNSASPNQAYAQIDTQSACTNVSMVNNLMVAPRNSTGVTNGATAYLFDEPATTISTFNSSNIVHTRNVYAGGDLTPVAAALANNTDLGRTYNATNLFLTPSINSAVADFRLRPAAAAVDYGSVIGYRSTRDLAGNPRSLTGATDTGAYETVSGLAYSPVFNVASGNYFGTTQSVTITSDNVAPASIIFTTNGTTPAVDGSGNPTNGTLYSAAISIATNTTLKAIAWKSGLTTSPVSTAIYDFTNYSTLSSSLEIWTRDATGNGQKLTDTNSVGLTSSTIHSGTRAIQGLSRTPGAAMRYTTNGVTNPTATTGTPQEYRGYSVIDYAQMRYGAFKSGRADSSILSAEITIRASMGNTADGTVVTNFGANVIRFVRFQAAEAFSAANIYARIVGLTGSYRAAIYSDSASAPSAKLAESSLVTNPVTGWTAFPLTARVTLDESSYYWLAIWSSSASAGIYATTTGGTVREVANSSPWPTTASATTAVAGTANYAIYAMNLPPNLAPVVNAGTDQTNSLSVLANLSGTASDDGVPVAPVALMTAWSKVSGPGTVTFANSNAPATTVDFSAVGTYVLRLTGRDAHLTTTDDVTVTKTAIKEMPVIASLPTTTAITYGQALSNSTLGAGLVTNSAGATVPGAFSFVAPSIMPNAGSTNVLVLFTPSDFATYNTNGATVTVTVNQASLVVTANNKSTNFTGVAFSGGNGVTYSGFVNGETSAVLGGTLSYGGSSQGATNMGSYAIVPSGLTAANYNLIFVNGVLSIGPATMYLNDNFSDNERATQALPSSAKWFVVANNASVISGLTATNGDLRQPYLTTSAASILMAYFTASGSPVGLATNDSITATFNLTQDQIVSSANGLRIGFYNSGGTRVSADAQAAGVAAFDGHQGYILDFNPGSYAAGFPGRVTERRTSSASASLFAGTTSTLGSGTSSGGAALTASVAAVVSMTITRTTNGITISGSLNGSTYSATDNYAGGDTTVFTNFDTIAVFASSALTINSVPAGKSLIVDDMMVTSTPPSVRWAVGDGNWDTTTANWQLVGGGSGVLFANNDPVLLDDNATGSSPITINLAASRTPWSVTNNSTKNYTLTGAGIGGAAALTKLGSSTLTLANTNTFTGGTTISAGTLLVKSPGSLATNNAVTVQSAATLGGNGTINGAVTVNVGAALAPGLGNVGTLTLASAPALNGSVVAEVNATNAQTADKLVVSAGTLTYGGSLVVTNVGAALTGGETFTLFNAPSYAGNFTNYNLQNPGANLNWWVGNLTNNGTLFVNRAPTVNAASYSRASRVSLKLPVANLMTNASDADGHARFWVGVSATTTNGLTLTSDANFVYVPTNNVTDQFSYTVRDNYGGTNSGTVTLTVAVPASGQPLNLNPNTNSTVTVNFAGVPGLGYTVERGTNVAFTGVVRTWLVTAPTGGLFQVTDNFSDLGTLPFVPSAAYYRLKYSGQ